MLMIYRFLYLFSVVTFSLFLCLLVCHVSSAARACSIMGEEEYDIILRLVIGKGLKMEVCKRTTVVKSAITKYYRNRDRYSCQGNPPKLYFDNKIVLTRCEYQQTVQKHYHQSKGIGPRRLYHYLKRQYAGLSEKVISGVMKKSIVHQKLNARFTNKAPLKHIESTTVHETLQIDLIDMTRQKITLNRKVYQYILSILDVFSRYTWLCPLENKKSSSVKKQLLLVYKEFGYPQRVQHDRATEFQAEVKEMHCANNIKIIRSRPCHPQSQGKVERMHQTLKRKMEYDLLSMKKLGSELG